MENQDAIIHGDLIDRAKLNERSAQFDLYRQYNRAMYNTALRITKNTALAEDVIQESFLNAFKSLATYRGDASFGTWLKRIVINKAISLSKKELRWVFRDDNHDSEIHVEKDEDIVYEVERVKRAIADLPSGFRSVLSLYLLEGYDHKEIAEILNISESTSKTQYMRAKDRIKRELKEELNYG